MTPTLTPAIALDYLRELSSDIRAGVLLDADGELLAGPQALADPARDLLAAAGDAAIGADVLQGSSTVFMARTRSYALVVVCGRFALPALVRFDLRAVLADLEGERPITPKASAA